MMGGGMMWPGTWGRGMMGGGFGLLGWLGVIIAWLTRLGILALLVVGVLWLIRAVGQSGGATVATTPAAAPKAETGKTCPACGKPVQDDWQVCPYCGGALK
ncbi:MAG TPA: zinc ribbon domain-containing protein [Chloroflexi bacterium]|nr:zinc ribbon domain-containing protein [Chloroflexota bacterium]